MQTGCRLGWSDTSPKHWSAHDDVYDEWRPLTRLIAVWHATASVVHPVCHRHLRPFGVSANRVGSRNTGVCDVTATAIWFVAGHRPFVCGPAAAGTRWAVVCRDVAWRPPLYRRVLRLIGRQCRREVIAHWTLPVHRSTSPTTAAAAAAATAAAVTGKSTCYVARHST